VAQDGKLKHGVDLAERELLSFHVSDNSNRGPESYVLRSGVVDKQTTRFAMAFE